MPELEQVVREIRASGHSYHETVRSPALSAGVYLLAKGGEDRQHPHSEDEVYYVLSGRARFLCGPSDRPVGPGEWLFVPARTVHRFHDIAEELTLLVFFGPAESVGPEHP